MMGESEKAISDLTAGIGLKPDEAMAFYYRGLAYRAKGDSAKADKDLEHAKRLAPAKAPASSK